MAATEHNEKSFKSRRYAVAAAPFVIAMAALYNWIICPHLGYLHAMQRLEPVLCRVADELDMRYGIRDERLLRLRTLRRQVAQARTVFFTDDEARQFIHELHNLAEETGCTLVRAALVQEDAGAAEADTDTPGVVQSFRLQVTVVGGHEQIVALLRGLQERRRRVEVDSCQFELIDPAGGRLELQIDLAIHAIEHTTLCRITVQCMGASKESAYVGAIQGKEEDRSGKDPDRR